MSRLPSTLSTTQHWSGPCPVSGGGMSLGASAGRSSVYRLYVFAEKRTLDDFALHHKMDVGSAGPSVEGHTGGQVDPTTRIFQQGSTKLYTYSKSKRALSGGGVETLSVDRSAIREYYGHDFSPEDILEGRIGIGMEATKPHLASLYIRMDKAASIQYEEDVKLKMQRELEQKRAAAAAAKKEASASSSSSSSSEGEEEEGKHPKGVRAGVVPLVATGAAVPIAGTAMAASRDAPPVAASRFEPGPTQVTQTQHREFPAPSQQQYQESRVVGETTVPVGEVKVPVVEKAPLVETTTTTTAQPAPQTVTTSSQAAYAVQEVRELPRATDEVAAAAKAAVQLQVPPAPPQTIEVSPTVPEQAIPQGPIEVVEQLRQAPKGPRTVPAVVHVAPYAPPVPPEPTARGEVAVGGYHDRDVYTPIEGLETAEQPVSTHPQDVVIRDVGVEKHVTPEARVSEDLAKMSMAPVESVGATPGVSVGVIAAEPVAAGQPRETATEGFTQLTAGQGQGQQHYVSGGEGQQQQMPIQQQQQTVQQQQQVPVAGVQTYVSGQPIEVQGQPQYVQGQQPQYTSGGGYSSQQPQGKVGPGFMTAEAERVAQQQGQPLAPPEVAATQILGQQPQQQYYQQPQQQGQPVPQQQGQYYQQQPQYQQQQAAYEQVPQYAKGTTVGAQPEVTAYESPAGSDTTSRNIPIA
eukprot:jgi/Mesvir1/25737/Mv01919-RA.2